MTDLQKIIEVSALETEVCGMVAENKQREIKGLSLAFDNRQFCYMADKIRKLNDK